MKKKRMNALLLVAAILAGVATVNAQAVGGSGTTGFVPLWTSSSTIGNSLLFQSGGNLTTSGNIIASGIKARAFSGNGSGLTGVNAAHLGGIAPGGFAQLAASNTFSGTVAAATINSANPYQIGGIPVLSITGESNLYVGQSAGGGAGAGNTGTFNIAAGSFALSSNTGGSYNTATGANALLSNSTGGSNTATGAYALLSNTTGDLNTGVGDGALENNTTGRSNTAVGEALHSNTTGDYNTAIGFDALFNNTTGSGNTAVGEFAMGNPFTAAIFTGSGNTAIGLLAGSAFTGSESSNIDIKNQGVAGDSGIIRIGTAGQQTATFIAGITGVTTGSSTTSTVLVDNNGQLGTIASSRRYKDDIRDMGAASDGLLRLRPVTFRYKKPYADGSKPIQFGLIAEEVAEVYPDLVVRGQDGQVETVQYYKLDAMLLNEVQKLAKQHATDQGEIAQLRSQIAEQQSAMEQLQAQVRVIRAALAGGGSADGEHRLAVVGPAGVRP